MALLVACVTWIFGARSQNNRYVGRQRDFNKILFYLNRRQFSKRGIVFSSGKYGAYLVIKLRLGNAELLAQQVRDSIGDEDTRVFRKTEFSKSLLIESLDESKFDESEDSRKNLMDDFMQRDLWREDGAIDEVLRLRINELLLKEEADLDWEAQDKTDEFTGPTGAELIEQEKAKIINQIRCDSSSSNSPSKNNTSTPKRYELESKDIFEEKKSPIDQNLRNRNQSSFLYNGKLPDSLNETSINPKPRAVTRRRFDTFVTAGGLNEPLLIGDSASDFHTVVDFDKLTVGHTTHNQNYVASLPIPETHTEDRLTSSYPVDDIMHGEGVKESCHGDTENDDKFEDGCINDDDLEFHSVIDMQTVDNRSFVSAETNTRSKKI